MAYITYDDKENLNTNPIIPDNNKIRDIDMNEIKQVVNDNADEMLTAYNVKTMRTESDEDTYSCNYINDKLYKGLGNSYNIDTIKESGIYGILNATGTLPPGYSASDNNIFIQCLMWGQEYGRQILHDVRTRKTYVRNLNNNHWYAWNEYVESFVLYNGGGVYSGNITLNDNISNYEYVEIYYSSNDGGSASSKKARVNKAGSTIIDPNFWWYVSGTLYFKYAKVTINGTTATVSDGTQTGFINIPISSGNYISINKIVGYR